MNKAKITDTCHPGRQWFWNVNSLNTVKFPVEIFDKWREKKKKKEGFDN